MKYQTIKFSIKDRIGTLTLDRPNLHNAINQEMLEEISNVIDNCEGDKDVHVLVVTGEGEKAFSSGADIKELASVSKDESARIIDYGRKVIFKVEDLSIPTIAALKGYTIGGGCELALACDMRLALDNTVIGFSETKIGSIPNWGGITKLALLIGWGRAKELIFSAGLIDANEAMRIGLINHTYSKEAFIPGVYELAQNIAKNSPLSIKLVKQVIADVYNPQIDIGSNAESLAVEVCSQSEDQKEGRAAFIEKRQPDFRGE